MGARCAPAPLPEKPPNLCHDSLPGRLGLGTWERPAPPRPGPNRRAGARPQPSSWLRVLRVQTCGELPRCVATVWLLSRDPAVRHLQFIPWVPDNGGGPGGGRTLWVPDISVSSSVSWGRLRGWLAGQHLQPDGKPWTVSCPCRRLLGNPELSQTISGSRCSRAEGQRALE